MSRPSNVYVLLLNDTPVGAWTVKYELKEYLTYNNIIDGVVLRFRNGAHLHGFNRLPLPLIMTIDEFVSDKRFTK